MNSESTFISKNTEQLIRAVAKTGFITKNQWRKYFFTGGVKSWRNKSWSELTQRKLFQSYSPSHTSSVLTLNKRSKIVQAVLGTAPVNPPFIANLPHDEILMNGLFALDRNSAVKDWKTEAELKQFSPANFRIESQGQMIKFPDAVLTVSENENQKIVAVELERTQKAKKRYVQILSCYAAMSGVDVIAWITSHSSIFELLKIVMKEVYFPTDRIRVVNITEAQWARQPEEILKIINI